MNVEVTKHPREGLKWALSQFLIAKDRKWRNETANGMLCVMYVFKDIGLITSAEWDIWRWLIDAAHAYVDERFIHTSCPGCGNKHAEFRCVRCKKPTFHHVGCLPELAQDGRMTQDGLRCKNCPDPR